MLTDSHIFHKLLSHRARGYGAPEGSQEALELACQSAVPYIELDTRIGLDCKLYVHHDPLARANKPDSRGQIRPFRYRPRDLLSLKDAIKVFARLSFPHQRLCLDVKDIGFENEHIKEILEAGIEHRVVFISWNPKTLFTISQINAIFPLILSWLPLQRLGLFGSTISQLIYTRKLSFKHFVICGTENPIKSLANFNLGYQHALIGKTLPQNLTELLANSGGGICIPTTLYCACLGTHAKASKLQLWVYSVQAHTDFIKFASMKTVDVVFSDCAARSLASLDKGAHSTTEY